MAAYRLLRAALGPLGVRTLRLACGTFEPCVRAAATGEGGTPLEVDPGLLDEAAAAARPGLPHGIWEIDLEAGEARPAPVTPARALGDWLLGQGVAQFSWTTGALADTEDHIPDARGTDGLPATPCEGISWAATVAERGVEAGRGRHTLDCAAGEVATAPYPGPARLLAQVLDRAGATELRWEVVWEDDETRLERLWGRAADGEELDLPDEEELLGKLLCELDIDMEAGVYAFDTDSCAMRNLYA